MVGLPMECQEECLEECLEECQEECLAECQEECPMLLDRGLVEQDQLLKKLIN